MELMETSWIAQGIRLVTHIQANFSFPRDDSGPPSAGEHGTLHTNRSKDPGV